MKRTKTEYGFECTLLNGYDQDRKLFIFSSLKKMMKKVHEIREQYKGDWFHLWMRKITYKKGKKNKRPTKEQRWYGVLACKWDKQVLIIEHPSMKENKRKVKEYYIHETK